MGPSAPVRAHASADVRRNAGSARWERKVELAMPRLTPLLFVLSFGGRFTACAAEVPMGHRDFYPSEERPVGWRGDGTGVFPGGTLPTAWNVEKGEGALWKAALPTRGNGAVLVDRD